MNSQAELESQFILRMPADPAKTLREVIRNNGNLKDRFSIKMEDDMRHAEVRVDQHLMSAKVLDMPTVLESLKTIDNKSFYKTADICQVVVCRDENDETTDEDSPQKTKKKDPNKVDKKFLFPHGMAPPLKNVRKRRFRKTLKKKNVEAPEIEKEVKRLLRSDNDAVSVKWEVINEDEENRFNTKGVVIKKEPIEPPNQNVAEHDIFGGAVSDSDEEEPQLNVLDLDENSQNTADDSHLSDSNSMMIHSEVKQLTEFTSDMFRGIESSPTMLDYYQPPPSNLASYAGSVNKGSIEMRLEELHHELTDLKAQQQQQESKIESIENLALRQRFQDNLEMLLQQQIEKEQEKYELEEMLKHHYD